MHAQTSDSQAETVNAARRVGPHANAVEFSLSSSNVKSSWSAAFARAPIQWLTFVLAYVLCVEIGLATYVPAGSNAAYWPAGGLLTASLLLCPRHRRWYFIVAAIGVDIAARWWWPGATWIESIGWAVAHTMEALLAAWLMRRFVADPVDFKSLFRVIAFTLIAAVVAPACYATLIESTKPLWSAESFSLRHWYFRWSGHAMGMLTIGAAIVSLATDLDWTLTLKRRAVFFGVIALGCVIAMTYLGFGSTRRIGVEEFQLPLLVMPVLVASALFVNRPGTLAIALLVSLVAITATCQGVGAASPSPAQSFVRQSTLFAFVLMAMLWPLIVATVIEEKLVMSRQYSRQFDHLQQVLENSSDSISLKDSKGRYLLVNESAAKLMQTTVPEMLGRRAHDFLSPEIATQLERLELLAKEGRISETVEEHWNDHGQQRIFVVSRNSWPRTGDVEKGLVIIAREVTEIRRQKLALRHSEQRFQALVNSVPTCIFEADQFGQCRYVSSHWTELSGQSVAEAIDLGWLNAVHEHDRSEVIRVWREFGAGAIAQFSREVRLRRPDSSVTWVEFHIGALRSEDGLATGGIGAIIDITPRKYAIENLRESEELFRMLANAAPVMIWRTDDEQRCSFLNDRWLEFIGMDPAQAENGWDERIHPDDRDRRSNAVEAAFSTRATYELDYRVMRHDGEYRWIVDSGVPIFDEHGNFGGFIGGCIDITERHSAQRAIEELNQELELRVAQRTSALTAANAQLQQEIEVRREILERLEQKQGELAHVSRVTALGEMAAGLAHELKQPLHAIRNYVSGLKMLSKNGESSALVTVAMSEIDRETHRAAAIIDRIRSFASRTPASHTPLYLEAVMEDSIALLQSEAARRGVRVRFTSAAPRGVRVRGDWIQIQQVLVNLIQNAVDAVEANTDDREVRLALSVEEGKAVIECRDHGPGIAPEDRDKIFDPFYTRKPTGLGMGLAISRSIIEAHFGKIIILDTGPQGTTMRITLPLIRDEVAPATCGAPAGTPATAVS
jgi:PAS domain S-box-containing protein